MASIVGMRVFDYYVHHEHVSNWFMFSINMISMLCYIERRDRERNGNRSEGRPIMMFPLDIIVGICERAGVAVKRAPKHPDYQFSWISAIADGAQTAGSANGGTVYVVETLEQAPAGATCVITGASADPDAIDPNANHILISTDLPPAVVADHIQHRLVEIIEWNDEMAQMLEEGCINQDLLKASEPVLECYVGLSDSTFSHIAHTPNIQPLDDFSRYFVEHGNYNPSTIDEVRRRGLMRQWNLQEWTSVHNEGTPPMRFPYAHRVIKQHGRYAGHLLMVSPSRITAQHVFLFNLLAKKVEACLARHWRLENPLEQRYTYLLKEILTGNTYDEEKLEERARMHGLPLAGLFEICLIDSAWKTMPTEYFAKQVLQEIPDAKVAMNDEQVAVLLCANEKRSGQLAGLERSLCELAERMGVEGGLSEKFEHLAQAAFELEKARIALRYGHRHSRRYVVFDPPDTGTTTLYRFRRYFPYFATDPFTRSEKFVAKLLASGNPIAKLKEADREHGTADYEILRIYLRSEGRINAVCEAMHMHRNTVTYRLEKIRKTIGTELDDGDTRMYLRILYLLTS